VPIPDAGPNKDSLSLFCIKMSDMATLEALPLAPMSMVTTIALVFAISFLVAVIVIGVAILWKRKASCALPPYSSASMVENIHAVGVKEGLYQMERDRNLFFGIEPGQPGGTKYGSTYRMRIPTVNPMIFSSDHVLCRLVLSGDARSGIAEAEKSLMSMPLNFIDRSGFNLFTHRTANPEHAEARKNMVQSFSTTNLTRTWPHLKNILHEQFHEFRKFAATGETVEMKHVFSMFIMRALSRGAFGVEFTADGTESESTVNGEQFVQDMEICTVEAGFRIMNPFRQYMCWTQSYKADAAAAGRIKAASEKIIRLNREKLAATFPDGEVRPFSIVDHITMHSYKDETARLSDLALMMFAGHDTTLSTFGFLMMELTRNLHIKAKLQRELAEFMPENRSLDSIMHNSSFNDRMLLSSIAGCEYLNWCVKEALRLWPAAAGGPLRELTEDLEYEGMFLPKGAMFASNYYSMFRERWIDQPTTFLPERWGDDNPQLPQLKEMLMPFSLGRRSCIGQNMAMFQLKIVAAHFLHYFDFELMQEPNFEFFITLKPTDLMMRVRERK
jgi:cytochrome P450